MRKFTYLISTNDELPKAGDLVLDTSMIPVPENDTAFKMAFNTLPIQFKMDIIKHFGGYSSFNAIEKKLSDDYNPHEKKITCTFIGLKEQV